MTSCFIAGRSIRSVGPLLDSPRPPVCRNADVCSTGLGQLAGHPETHYSVVNLTT